MITLNDLLAATGGQSVGPIHATFFSNFAFDSRLIQPGELFLAVKSERADGHDYIDEACAKGAAGVMAQRSVRVDGAKVTVIVVDDTQAALPRWGRYILGKYGSEVIGVTGSTGKTSSKEALAHVLAAQFDVFKNPGNWNGRYGLPLALGQLRADQPLAVLEMASDSRGEVADLVAMAPPRVAVVTTVQPTHLETFGDLESIAEEKADLVRGLPADGVAFLNADDPRVRAMAKLTDAPVLLFGFAPDADIVASNVKVTPEGTYFRLHLGDREGTPLHLHLGDRKGTPLQASKTAPTPSPSPNTRGGEHFSIGGREHPSACSSLPSLSIGGEEHPSAYSSLPSLSIGGGAGGGGSPLFVPLLGAHAIYPALAAVGVGLYYGMGLDEIGARLATLARVPGRVNPLAGMGGSLLLDDSYNASPAAMVAALELLAALPAQRRVAILGDMAELGDYSAEGHALVGRRAAQVVDQLVTKGELARGIAQEAELAGLDAGQITVAYTTDDVVSAVSGQLSAGDVVLVKGGMSARLERVSARLLAKPHDVSHLVRQDKAWQEIVTLRLNRPTWLEVNLEAIAHNTRRIKEIVGAKVAIMAVMKADAYGHGALKVAQTALNNGASWVGVACLPEAQALRDAGISAPILVLGYTPAWQARASLRYKLRMTLFSLDVARALSKAAVAMDREARVHIKVDTGMHRLGLFPHEVVDFVKQIRQLPNLVIEGIFTHFSVADDADAWHRSYTEQQLQRFQGALKELAEEGIQIPIVHAANSAGTLAWPAAHFNMVRPGIVFYGLAPSPDVPLPDFRPALSWKTQIAQVKALAPHSYVSYGATYETDSTQRIAVIPVGYADGFRRAPTRWKEVLVRGQRAPLVGRVCMDQTMINVTHIPNVRQGDEVVLIGQQANQQITVEQVAAWLGTIPYEVVSEILARVPRV